MVKINSIIAEVEIKEEEEALTIEDLEEDLTIVAMIEVTSTDITKVSTEPIKVVIILCLRTIRL